ncbi:hypothetical protein [Methylophaga sulfidovorans]|uniref:Lipoprotein-attachment site-containing protein n=1 Tax=Methylophaga sulfidovorans TaxID=45496 RepID=A0A1I3U9Z1_9GAMM|nr:hypothetical protein [Methylophaga sulfidovorans]SFJ78581.1 hypothetical protein SAMN04488079_101205 [Methylophaga sulfidovorans]
MLIHVLKLLSLSALLFLSACHHFHPHQAMPPGHDPNGPGNSENAPGHNK